MTVLLSHSIRLKVILAALLSSLLVLTAARAHEVQPGVMDIEMVEDKLEIFVEWIIEAPVAGIDLEGLEDTNASDQEDEYLRLRALDPAAMEDAFRAAWPGLRDKFFIMAGDVRLTPELTSISIPAPGDIELARTSTIELTAILPPGNDPITIGWAADLGPLIVRQRTIEDGYAGYLTAGQISDPIPRTGGSAQGAFKAFLDYVAVGFDHIVPQGLDHILFVLGLFLLSLNLRPLLWQVTAFTLAHTVTLALGALDILRLPPELVEPLIAASIVYVGIENVLVRRLVPWRPVVVFCFGLLHGLGFAAVLQDFGLGSSNFVAKLIGFNVGVEVGQLAVIAAAWIALAALFGRYEWYHRRIAAPVSIAIAMIAVFWVFERTDVIGATGPWALFSALTEGGFSTVWTLAAGAALAFLLTVVSLVGSTYDNVRDFAGILTSFGMFLAVVAAFTSGDWLVTLFLTLIWVLALRMQSLGGPDTAREFP
ncbi:MAG: HupE/UreJ family protein [Silicimonas sp.]|nr:HupE/UreJ family protein [Silicimonas sp.]